MSHTTTLKSVVIRDVAALAAAVAELQAAKINCELVRDTKPRMFYSTQHGKCDYVLSLPTCRFDVGFDKQADGTYVPVFDEWQNHIGAVIGVPGYSGQDKTQAQIGRLMQGYAKHAAINAAVSQGYMVESSTVDAEGNVQLVLTGM